MTPAQIAVLSRAADDTHLRGTALIFEANSGNMLQVRWLLGKKFVRYVNQDRQLRLVATVAGRRALKNAARNVARKHATKSQVASDRMLAAMEKERAGF